MGTLDSVRDTKPPPYRILHQTPNSEVYYGEIHLLLYFKLPLEFITIVSVLVFRSNRNSFDRKRNPSRLAVAV